MSNPFDNMPDVGKGKKVQGTAPQSNRVLPLIIGVVLLALVMCVVLAGVGWFVLQGRGGAATTTSNNTPSTASQNQPEKQGQAVAVSSNVRIAYSVERGGNAEGKLVWLARGDGSEAKQLLTQASSPVFSPDGSQIAFYHWTDGIYIANADGGNPKKILGESNAKYLAWSHDGKWIAFSSQPSQQEGAPVNIDAIRVDGSGRRTIVIGGRQPTWSPDDTMVAFASCRGSDCGIFKASSGGGDLGSLVVGDLATNPAWSPDGKKILYQADADSVKQLFVVNVDGTGKKQITSGTNPHVGAQWSPDGSTIYFRAAEGGAWGIWKMNADGSNPVKIASDVPPVDWALERLALSK